MPAKNTTPAPAARTTAPGGAARSTPRCPGSHGRGGGSNPRTGSGAPSRGQRKIRPADRAGTRGGSGATGAAATAARRATTTGDRAATPGDRRTTADGTATAAARPDGNMLVIALTSTTARIAWRVRRPRCGRGRVGGLMGRACPWWPAVHNVTTAELWTERVLWMTLRTADRSAMPEPGHDRQRPAADCGPGSPVAGVAPRRRYLTWVNTLAWSLWTTSTGLAGAGAGRAARVRRTAWGHTPTSW